MFKIFNFYEGRNLYEIRYLALSYDHKLLDGREGVLFLKRIKDLVEEPRKMLVNL